MRYLLLSQIRRDTESFVQYWTTLLILKRRKSKFSYYLHNFCQREPHF